MRTLAIINPKSGRSEDLADVAAAVRAHPAMDDPDIRITGAPGDASLLARAGARQGFGRIVAVGGDGTLNEVVDALGSLDEEPREGLVVGILPRGSGNDFARSVGVPPDFDDALDALDLLVPRRVDLVRVTGDFERHYINVSAGGFSGEVGETVEREWKERWGPLAYARGAVEVLPDPDAYTIEIALDDEEPRTLDALNVAVANGRTVAGGIPVAPEALLDDGLLDVLVVRDAPVAGVAAFGSRCLVGRHLDHEMADFARASRVRLEATPPMPVNVDGELLGSTPLEYRVMPGALRFLAAPDAPAFGASPDD